MSGQLVNFLNQNSVGAALQPDYNFSNPDTVVKDFPSVQLADREAASLCTAVPSELRWSGLQLPLLPLLLARVPA